MWFSFLCYSTLCLMNGKLRLLVSITQSLFFFFAFHLMCLEGGVLSSLEEKKKKWKKNKIWRSCGLSFSTCVRSSSGARTLSAVGLDPVRSQIRAPVFFLFLFLAMVIHHHSKHWWLWWSSWSCKRFPYISPFLFLLSFPWLCVCIILVVIIVAGM